MALKVTPARILPASTFFPMRMLRSRRHVGPPAWKCRRPDVSASRPWVRSDAVRTPADLKANAAVRKEWLEV